MVPSLGFVGHVVSVITNPLCCWSTEVGADKNAYLRDFPGGAVVKNPPANAGDMGSIPGPGGSHMPQSN